jgi:hypothetical protein
MSGRFITPRIAASCLAVLLMLPLAPATGGTVAAFGSTSTDAMALPRSSLTPAMVVTAFAAVGLPLRRIQVSPPSGPHEVVLYYVNYKTFSLTVFIEASAYQAGQIFRDLSPVWAYDGWPSRLLRNIVVAIQPAGMEAGHAARVRPMPKAALRALVTLSRR